MNPRIVFVVGNSRSGTTMLARMLGLHSVVHTFRELHFFEELWSPGDQSRELTTAEAVALAGRLLHNGRDWYLSAYDPAVHADGARQLVAALGQPLRPHEVFRAVLAQEAAVHGAQVVCEQTPRNVFYVEEILELFPEAVVVTLVRNPLDVLLSQRNWWKRRFRGSSATPLRVALRQWIDYHPITTSLLWRGGVRAADAHAGNPRVHALRFEDLLVDPEVAVGSVLEHVGLAFEPAMLDVPRQSSSNALDRDGVGIDPSVRGRGVQGLPAAEVWVSQRVTGSLARRHGYAGVAVTPTPWALAWCLVSWPVKTALALAMNIGRTKSLATSIRRRLSVRGRGAAQPGGEVAA